MALIGTTFALVALGLSVVTIARDVAELVRGIQSINPGLGGWV